MVMKKQNLLMYILNTAFMLTLHFLPLRSYDIREEARI